jgi:hypothetical protein
MQGSCYRNRDGCLSAIVGTRFESLGRNEFNGKVTQASVVRVKRLNAAGNAVLVHNSREFDYTVDLNAVPGQ